MIRNLFISILGISLSTGLVIALFMLLAPLFRKRYASRWSCYIWIFIALRLLVPINGSSIVGFVKSMASPASSMQQETADSPVINTPKQRVVIEIPEQMTTEITVQKEERKTITMLDIAAYVWFAGCIVFLAIPVFSCINFRIQISRNKTAVENGPVKTQLQKLSRELHIRRPVPAVEYDGTVSPIITGIFIPVVVLPRKDYTEKEFYFILKHELIHLKRNDVLVKFLYMAANALHWFNPLVYIMRKQAVVDMELSCDERVISGTAYADRKDYTETLFSTIKETRTKKTYLSTGFYGGKRIMKKRFKNILTRSEKKNGLPVLAAAMAVTLAAGTLVGCSEAKKPAANKSGLVQTANKNTDGGILKQISGRWMIDFGRTDSSLWGTGISNGNEMVITADGVFTYYIGIGTGGTGQCKIKDGSVTVEITPYEELSSEKEILTFSYEGKAKNEYIRMDWHGEDVYWTREGASGTKKETADTPSSPKELTIYKEGEPEVRQTTNTIGVGYSVYFPEGEWTENTLKNFSAAMPDDSWLTNGRDIWNADVNNRVQMRVTHYTELSAAARLEEAFTQAGYAQENNELVKTEGDLVIKVRLYDNEDDTWSVCYCYPSEAEEGWGTELPVIADTFAVTALSEDSKAIQRTVKGFTAAYFTRDAKELEKYLEHPSETAAEIYEGTETVNRMTVKGYTEDEVFPFGSETSASVEFKEGSEDSFTYLTLSLIKQENGWKVKSYGLEK